jgi:hypothetical protein
MWLLMIYIFYFFLFISRLNTTLEDLEENIRESITPFYKPDRRANADLLNEVQRAFVKYRVSTMIDNKEGITPARIEQLIADGVEHRIWPEGYVVGDGNSDLNSYLSNRVRNEKKSQSKKMALKRQHDMISDFISSQCDEDRSTSS